jgi:hypothetical protein
MIDSTFKLDNDWQLKMRDRFLVPFYERIFRGRFVMLDGEESARDLNQLGIDSIGQQWGTAITIDEKITRWPEADRPYTNFLIETLSCSIHGMERDGWIHSKYTDRLVYCFMDKGDTRMLVYVLPFRSLREWFLPLVNTFEETTSEQPNRTKCRKAPIHVVVSAVAGCRHILLPDGHLQDARVLRYPWHLQLKGQ